MRLVKLCVVGLPLCLLGPLGCGAEEVAPETTEDPGMVDPVEEEPEVIGELNVWLDWIQWSKPFQAAQERALAENRLLLIKPIAFGTRETCW